MKPQHVQAKIDGRTYEIPEMWLNAVVRRMTYFDAILYWHRQQVLREAFDAEHAGRDGFTS